MPWLTPARLCVCVFAVGVLCLWLLLQTFSGPVRRRLAPRSWGAEASVREQDLPSQDSKVGSPTAAGGAAGQKRGSKGLLGSTAAAWEGRPASLTHQGVSRIDEGDGGEEM